MNFPNIGLTISKISKSQDFQDLSLGIENFNPKISKESPRLCPDLSMDFVRLIFFKVFWMLINVQKKFLENSDFKVAFKTVF